MENSTVMLKQCKNIYVNSNFYIVDKSKEPDTVLETDYSETLITDLQGYLRTEYRNRQAWICTQPWISDKECHISDFFVPLDINPVTLNDQGWFIDRNTVVSIEELFQNDRRFHPSKRILIQGESGSGKSTLLRKLALDWAMQKDGYLSHFTLVFLLQLKYMDLDIDDALKDQILLKNFEEGYKGIIWDYIRKHQHEVLFLLDGFDEMPYEYKKTGTFDRLCKGVTIPEACVVITCRPHAMTEIIKHCDKKFAVKGFNQKGSDKFVSHFIQRQFKTDDNNTKLFGEFLLEFLSCGKPVIIKSLTENPLTLNLLCTLLKEKYMLNNVNNSSKLTTGIYLGICQCFYQRTLLRKQMNCENNSFERLFKELGRLCLKAVKTKQCFIRVDDFDFSFSKKFLCDIGLFQHTDNGCIELLHQSFMDFFAAFYLKMQCLDDIQSFKKEICDIVTESNVGSLMLPLEVFIFLCGLLQERAHIFFNSLPKDIYCRLNSHELVNHLSYLIQECGNSDENMLAIQKFFPEHLILDRILTLHAFTNIIPGLSLILSHKHCTVKSIVISSDTILSCCLNGRDAFYQLLGSLCRNKSIKSVDVRMFTSFGNFENFSNRENIKYAFREFCKFGLSDKELISLSMKCDFSFEDVAQEVYELLKSHTTLQNISLVSTNKGLSAELMAIERILDALKDNSNIESLSLTGFCYHHNSWKKFEFILENYRLKHLELSITQEINLIEKMKKHLHSISQHSLTYVSALDSMFKSFSSKTCALESLDFIGTLLSSSDIINLSEALESNTSIKSLKLFNSCAKFKHLHPLISAISKSSITDLFIGSSVYLNARDKSVRLLSGLLTKENLVKLSFSGIKFCILDYDLLKNLANNLNISCVKMLNFIQCSIILSYKSNADIKTMPDYKDIKKLLPIKMNNLESLHLHLSINVNNFQESWVKQIESFKKALNLKELNVTGDSTVIEDILFEQICSCLLNFKHLEKLTLQSCHFKIDDDDVCLNAYKLLTIQLRLKWIEFKGCCFESKNSKKSFFSRLAVITLNTQHICDFLFSWVNLFGNSPLINGFVSEFFSSLKINHSIRIHIKNWPKDLINNIYILCNNCQHLKMNIIWDKMHEMDCLLLNPLH
ncbi:nucleotide-binding oligomerization domain-containing protein 2-like [Centruroides vittatus]|uniref:nucleotide-binding oligomerization domain-containing protein 2-like n=1 Tax=Centruroides vittatus TaxID=120091 RepID=UPI00350EC6B8